MAKRVAVIDIGSNSVRMVIYEKTSRYAFSLLHEAKSRVRISENAYKHHGNLQDIPMQRAYDALENFLSIANSFKVRKTLCVATSALRDAPNKQKFVQKVQTKLKLNIKIISGEKEAHFGGVACYNLLPPLESALTIDIGGGSTEFSVIQNKNIIKTVSLNIGTVRLKELFCDASDLLGAQEEIDAQLSFLDSIDIDTLVGIGGTFRALSSSIMEASNYPLDKIHAYSYSAQTLQKQIDNILQADENSLKALKIKTNRFDVIKPGALILQRVLKKLNEPSIMTSGVGVREGVYLSDFLRNSKEKFPHNFNTSVKNILDSYVDNKEYATQLNKLSKNIFDLTYQYLELKKTYRYELALAAKLYPAGSKIHYYSQNKHAYNIIQNALEYGFSHESIVLIATLTKYTKNRLPAHSHLQKYASLLPQEHITNALSYILSLSIALLSHRPRNIDFTLEFKEGELRVVSKNNLYLCQQALEKIECTQSLKVRFIEKK